MGVAAVAGVAVLLWAAFVPASHPWLDRTGLGAPLRMIGIIPGPDGTAGDTRAAAGAPGQAPGAPRAQGGGAVRVVAIPVFLREPADRVTSIGTARGIRSATLSPEIAGRIETIAVTSGQFLKAGAEVARLEAEDARIARDRAALVRENADRALARLTRLQGSGATTDIQIQEAELAARQAALEERQAAYELTRHVITAPAPGWVGIVEAKAGDLVSAGDAIAQIEDRSTLLVDFRVPERLASILGVGDPVEAQAVSAGGTSFAGRVSAVDNQVDQSSRTLRVQAAIPNDGDRLRPGMAIALTIDIRSEPRPAVDPMAVQWASEGSFVWVLRDGAAMKLPVHIRQRDADAVVVDADFAPGDLVVTEGMSALRPGATAEAVGARARASATTGASDG
jgi:RND family efflux transporter MFP subunit